MSALGNLPDYWTGTSFFTSAIAPPAPDEVYMKEDPPTFYADVAEQAPSNLWPLLLLALFALVVISDNRAQKPRKR